MKKLKHINKQIYLFGPRNSLISVLLTVLASPIVMGAQVVEEPGPVEQDAFRTVMSFFGKFWKFMFWAIIIFIFGMIIYYLFKKLEDERKERDEPGYQVYKALKKTCMMQADGRRIRKSWSPVNLLWLGFPIVKKEHSAKFLDMTNKVLGYYRGESHTMDNTINYLAYKRKFFIFFEETFIIKIPRIIRIKSKSDKTGLEKADIVDLTALIKELPNNDIKVYCTGLERLGLYYYCPVFVIDDKRGNLDYRKVMEGSIVDTTYQTMVQRIVNVQAKMIEKATLSNPQIQQQRLGAEKTKEEQRLETGV
jgi:hypothetical protein